jgi:DNA polymerase-3 subunit alpha
MPMQRLAHEHQAVGFYLSGHPLDDYRGPLQRLGVLSHADLLRKAAGTTQTVARIAGSVAALDERKSARGNRFAFVRLSDPTGLFEVRVFSDVLEQARRHLDPGSNVVLTVEATLDGDELGMLARAVQPIDDATAGAASAGLRIFVNDDGAASSLAKCLGSIGNEVRTRRRGPVVLVLTHPELPGEVEIELPEPYPVTPQILNAIKSLPGVVHAEDF